ncbi:hypothetical protein OPT61_g10118 [Boeremia exigua]|uniref:Uncharacterized protein n=1 Tax=Boeremia exigua TaxID=749465 RepID=A0ACC2HR24_9PLEO|nr:hypothetical protein OPT61_g10118 [Boeremia exigua]
MTTSPTRTTLGESEAGVVETVEAEDEAPHARGPELIGMEDTGPQKQGAALDIEGAIGRPSLSKSPGPTTAPAAPNDAHMEDAADKNEDDQAAEEPAQDRGRRERGTERDQGCRHEVMLRR